MNINTLLLNQPDYPAKLAKINKPPDTLYCAGQAGELFGRPAVAIVGSRKVTPYGRAVTEQIAAALSRQGIVIVSGLALGVDALAHKAALDAGGLTVAVLPTGLNKIYPASHHQLAKRIVNSGGVLVSEYPAGAPVFKHNFISRNRLISGLSDAVLITEAAATSGSLHTARFARSQGRSVFAVPGNISSPISVGTNELIKSGATLTTSAQDIIDALHIKTRDEIGQAPKGGTPQEQAIIDLISSGISDEHELLATSRLEISNFNQALTMLEISGKIKNTGDGHWTI